jgi:hypothetical protein
MSSYWRFFFLIIFASCKEGPATITPALYLQQLDSIKRIAKAGDLIVRGGTDIESAVIREFSLQDKLFSHAGIVLKENNNLLVFHILGGISNKANSAILAEPLDTFLFYPQNNSAGIYSSKLTSLQIDSVYHFIDSLRKEKTTFDIKFNLFTPASKYCTELLADAMKYATQGRKQFAPASYSVYNTKYQFLANFKDSFIYFPLDKFHLDSFFSKKAHFLFPNYEMPVTSENKR